MVLSDDLSYVVRTELGEQTGDRYYQTADGRWWKDWDGVTRTGEEVKQLRLSKP
jgi:hypothetical protein